MSFSSNHNLYLVRVRVIKGKFWEQLWVLPLQGLKLFNCVQSSSSRSFLVADLLLLLLTLNLVLLVVVVGCCGGVSRLIELVGIFLDFFREGINFLVSS